MQRLLRDIILFCSILALLLWGVAAFTDRQLRKSSFDTFKVWKELGSNVNADILILGNSHAMVQIDPQIIGARLSLKAYNMGIPGYPFDMQLARYRYYRTHNAKPGTILITIDQNEFIEKTICYDKQQFLPYLYYRPIVNALPNYFVAYHYLPFLKYFGEGGLVKRAAHQFANKNDTGASLYINGYFGWDKPWNTKAYQEYLQNPGYTMPAIDREVFSRFKDFLAECRADSIKVVLVATPYYAGIYKTFYYPDNYYSFMKQTAAKFDAGYISFLKDPMTLDSNNFYNAYHLNKHAAEIMTKELCDSLVSIKALK